MTTFGAPGGSVDPTTLALELYVRGSYGGDPWSGTASTGGSGSRSLTAGAAPTVGAAQNGYTPADFNGAGHYLIGSGGFNWDAFISASAYYVECTFLLDTAAAAAGLAYNNAHLLSDNGGNIGLAISSSGVKAYHSDSGGLKETAWVAAATGAYHVAQWWYDGTDISLAVDGGTPVTVAAGSATVLNLITLRLGTNWNTSVFLDGRILDVKAAQSALAASRAGLYAHAAARYAI